ncbi:MAG: metal-dependent hydrolase [Gemmatimonadales bacterium]
MPSISHIAVGMAAGQGVTPSRRHRLAWLLWLVAVSCAADLDLGLALFGQPHNSIYGHRGLTHSLGFAVVAALATALLAPRWGRGRGSAAAVGFLAYGSHLVLDCLNVGSRGVPWFWPLSSAFHSLPWAPIPAVESASEFLTPRAFPVLGAELLLFAPFWLYALFGRPVAPSASEDPGVAGSGERRTGSARSARRTGAPWRRRRVERAVE